MKKVLILILVSLLVGCGTPQTSYTPVSPTAEPTPIPSEPEYWPTTGWRTSTPEEQGMDSVKLTKMVEFILKQNYDIHSVTVIRNGYLVADVTIHPFESNSKHNLASATKSITSALIGIAIQQGHINNVDQTVLSFFPERSAANLDANKKKITLEHLLTMSSGLDCRDNIDDWSRLIQMMDTDDWMQYMLDLPMAKPPGTRFEYCNGASFMLSAIIQETTGMNTLDFAKDHLFSPLGIDDVVWLSNLQGITLGHTRLIMKPHDMAKIGFLFLNEGRWDNEQILSADWVADSSHEHITDNYGYGYGYQWWVADSFYYAAGHGGQFIVVLPEHDMVIVFTGNNYMNRFPTDLFAYTISAVQSSTPLPPNPDGVEMLESKIKQAAQDQTEPEPVPPLPEIAQIVSGQTYILDPNPLALQSVSVTFPGEAEALLDITLNSDPLHVYNVRIDNPQIDMEIPVGLDNIYRYSPDLFGITSGSKGVWVSDETFVIYVDNIGSTGNDRCQITFKGEKITFEYKNEIGTTSINGRLEE